MAQEVTKTRRKLASADPTGITSAIQRRSDRAGLSITANLAEEERNAEARQKKQQEEIARQQQKEQLALAETESEVGRRRLLAKTGRRSLIASR